MIQNDAVNEAIVYILRHAGEDITAEEVAAHCHFSRAYFSRLFKKTAGISIYEYMKRVKLEQSAFRLKVERNRSITEIGAEYGYSASNYSSAFKQHHNMSPAVFRRSILQKSLRHPVFSGMDVCLESYEECSKKITGEQLEDLSVIYERRIGNYGALSSDWGAFMERYRDYITEQTLFVERTYDDPSITDADGCLYDICMTAPDSCSLANTEILQGGKYAVYHFKGPAEHIYAAYQSLFQVWLQRKGADMDERYSFEIYRKICCDPVYLEIDLCMPIK